MRSFSSKVSTNLIQYYTAHTTNCKEISAGCKLFVLYMIDNVNYDTYRIQHKADYVSDNHIVSLLGQMVLYIGKIFL